MFNIFKRKLNESIDLQREDLNGYPTEFTEQILDGEDCDALSNGHGEFGCLTNPIPVNGSLGEIKYLGKLRGKSGYALFFHRAGSARSPVTSYPVDVFDIVCMDGTQWNTLFFSMYHPRRSERAPNGYILMPVERNLKRDLPIAYGVNTFTENFPFSLPASIEKFYGESIGSVFARHAQEKLDKFAFIKPS